MSLKKLFLRFPSCLSRLVPGQGSHQRPSHPRGRETNPSQAEGSGNNGLNDLTARNRLLAPLPPGGKVVSNPGLSEDAMQRLEHNRGNRPIHRKNTFSFKPKIIGMEVRVAKKKSASESKIKNIATTEDRSGFRLMTNFVGYDHLKFYNPIYPYPTREYSKACEEPNICISTGNQLSVDSDDNETWFSAREDLSVVSDDNETWFSASEDLSVASDTQGSTGTSHSAATQRVSNVGATEHEKPALGWRDQLDTVATAYYSPPNNTGAKDPCKLDYFCERANVIAAMIAKSESAEVIGWVRADVNIINEPLERFTNNFRTHHAAALVRDQKKVYISDPLHGALEVSSGDDINQWISRSMDNQLIDAANYQFIHPNKGNDAGMNQAQPEAMSAEKLASVVNNYKGLILDKGFADSPIIDQALARLSLFRSAVVDHRLNLRYAKAVVAANLDPNSSIKEAKDFLWNKPFALKIPEQKGLAPAVEHSAEVKAIMWTLGRRVSERVEL